MSDERLPLTGDDDDEPQKSDEKPGSKKRQRGGEEAPGARTRRRHESELRGRLGAVLERLVETLEGRGDHELANAIREDSQAMVGGLVGITRPVAWLRGPILTALAVVEPLLAFGRVLRIVLGRLSARRAVAAEERELARQAAEAAEAEPFWSEMPEPELLSRADAGHPDAQAELERRARAG